MPESDQTYRLLVVDDEKNIRSTLRMVLEDNEDVVSILEGGQLKILDCGSAEEALRILREEGADLILLDIKLPQMDGMQMLAQVRGMTPPPEVIMISGHGTIQDAVAATRLGAYDFLEKPPERERVVLTVKNCFVKVVQDRKLRLSQRQEQERFRLLGSSRAIQQLWEEIRKVAPTNGRVLITGESGSGKEVVARAIHQLSRRADQPFIKVNCAAIPSELIEAELFGHERGAFTGAVGRRKGQFELANGGTLFLDEIGDMSLAAQAKVLRVLQTGELTRIGGEQVIQVDVRVIAASNKDLQKEVKEGRFREDLFYRLNVVPIHCPPLRERLGDLPELCAFFVEEFCRATGFKTKSIQPEVMEKLRSYNWPGNVRELQNVVERMVILSGETIGPQDVPPYVAPPPQPALDAKRFQGKKLKEVSEEVEREHIRATLLEYGWNISRAAQALGVERTNLHKKMKLLGIRRPREED